METQKSYSINDTKFISNFLEAKKGLFRLKIDIVCTQIKLCEELKNQIKLENEFCGWYKFVWN